MKTLPASEGERHQSTLNFFDNVKLARMKESELRKENEGMSHDLITVECIDLLVE